MKPPSSSRGLCYTRHRAAGLSTYERLQTGLQAKKIGRQNWQTKKPASEETGLSEPRPGIDPGTSILPRWRSTTELSGQQVKLYRSSRTLASGEAMACTTFNVFLFSTLPHESPALTRRPTNDQAPPQQLTQTHQHTNTKDRQESSSLPCRSLNHMRMTRLLADSLSKPLIPQIQA